jgi:hypothetical protein
MLGPVMPAPGGGDVRRLLALAFRRHQTGDSFHEVADPERTHHVGRWFVKSRPPVVFKSVTKMIKLEIQFDGETWFDQPIRCLTQPPGARVARPPGFVAHSSHRRTAEADQARIDLWIFLGGF